MNNDTKTKISDGFDIAIVSSSGFLVGSGAALGLFGTIGYINGTTGIITAINAGMNIVAGAVSSGLGGIGLATGVASALGIASVALIGAACIGLLTYIGYKSAKKVIQKRQEKRAKQSSKGNQSSISQEKTSEKNNEVNNTKENNNSKKNTSIQVSDPQNLDSGIAENKNKQI